MLNGVELGAATRRAALNELATMAPAWLQALVPPQRAAPDGKRSEEARLPREPAKRAA